MAVTSLISFGMFSRQSAAKLSLQRTQQDTINNKGTRSVLDEEQHLVFAYNDETFNDIPDIQNFNHI